MAALTFNKISKNHDILAMIKQSDEQLGIIGYTEHGIRHAKWVGRTAQKVLKSLGKDPRQAELAGIAGFMHDIGNLVNREDHAQAGAEFARSLLQGQPADRVQAVAHAIAAHRFRTGPEPETLEARVLHDADKLDAIGAIGPKISSLKTRISGLTLHRIVGSTK